MTDDNDQMDSLSFALRSRAARDAIDTKTDGTAFREWQAEEIERLVTGLPTGVLKGFYRRFEGERFTLDQVQNMMKEVRRHNAERHRRFFELDFGPAMANPRIMITSTKTRHEEHVELMSVSRDPPEPCPLCRRGVIRKSLPDPVESDEACDHCWYRFEFFAGSYRTTIGFQEYVGHYSESYSTWQHLGERIRAAQDEWKALWQDAGAVPFLETIREAGLGNDLPVLVFADWIEEHREATYPITLRSIRETRTV